MKKLTDYKKIRHLTNQISVEKVYPLSILEGFQSAAEKDMARSLLTQWYKYEG